MESGNKSLKIVSLGQCGVDHPAIARFCRDAVGAHVVGTDTFAQTLSVEGADLILVNRVLDATGESGLDFIRQFRADPNRQATPIVLVSNYADAQRDAQALGAAPGFGKSSLGRPESATALRTALGLA
jgi:two-component system, chemotaxis family, chemotaxis protein CheY